jgi:hypothetical protein
MSIPEERRNLLSGTRNPSKRILAKGYGETVQNINVFLRTLVLKSYD